MKARGSFLFWFTAASVLLVDQASKFFLREALLSGTITLIPGFLDLRAVWNSGVAFGMFARGGERLKILFVLVSVCAVLGLYFYARKVRDKTSRVFSGLVAGGALGNLVDRLLYGRVFDFLDLHLGPYHWPTFNLADAAITLGIVGLLVKGLRNP